MTNRQLLEHFLMQNLDGAYRFAYSYTNNAYDAEDVVNESVAKAIQKVHMLRNQEQIKSWFYKIISNTALTLLRKKKKILPLEDDTLADLLGGEADIDNLSFESMIHLLRPEYKSIIVLRFFEEMTLEEIAQTLNINLNTVKSRLYRALHQLRAEMEEQA